MNQPTQVLVIDDMAEIAEMVCACATALKMSCRATTRLDEFLQALTAETRILVIDMKMPEMNGRELMALLARHHCAARIILMSGVGSGVLAEAEAHGRSLGLNMLGSLPKPFRVAELTALLRRG